MTSCPFCSDVLLRHIRAGRAYWLCRRCRLEMITVNSNPALMDSEPAIAAPHLRDRPSTSPLSIPAQ